MQIVTWNVNSIEVRLPRVLDWAAVAVLARAGLELDDPATGLPGELRDDESRGSRRPSAGCTGSTHVTPQERGAIEAIQAAGELVDAFRVLHPDEVGYTWWDYREVISRRFSATVMPTHLYFNLFEECGRGSACLTSCNDFGSDATREPSLLRLRYGLKASDADTEDSAA